MLLSFLTLQHTLCDSCVLISCCMVSVPAGNEVFYDDSKLLLNACQGWEYLYQELDASQLDVQLQFEWSVCPVGWMLHQGLHRIPTRIVALARTYFSEVVKVVQLILVMPATNAVTERSFSTMRRIKSYLRSTMRQDRLNHLMTLHIYQDKLDRLGLNAVGVARIFGPHVRLLCKMHEIW